MIASSLHQGLTPRGRGVKPYCREDICCSKWLLYVTFRLLRPQFLYKLVRNIFYARFRAGGRKINKTGFFRVFCNGKFVKNIFIEVSSHFTFKICMLYIIISKYISLYRVFTTIYLVIISGNFINCSRQCFSYYWFYIYLMTPPHDI